MDFLLWVVSLIYIFIPRLYLVFGVFYSFISLGVNYKSISRD